MCPWSLRGTRIQMSLEVKADQLRMVSTLKDYLRKVDLLDQGIQTNKIPSAYAAQALKTFFPHKPPHRLREIVVRDPAATKHALLLAGGGAVTHRFGTDATGLYGVRQ